MKANNKYLIYFLPVTTTVFLSISQFIPFFSLIAMAPLFYFFDLYEDCRINRHRLFFSIMLSLVVSFSLWQFSSELGGFPGALFYGVWLAFSFIIYWFTNRHSKNRLGYFTIIIYWLALEYVVIKVGPEFSRFSLGAAFESMPDYTRWSSLTGLLGISLWVLLSNTLIYYVFFRNHAIWQGKIRWLSLAYAIILIVLPYTIFQFSGSDLNSATYLNVISYYSEQADFSSSTYPVNGEWIGKSAAWVAVLIIIYSFVKRKIA